MIIGIGIDLVEVERMAKDLHIKNGLTAEIFTQGEVVYCQKKRYPAQHFSARFCAKEALFKALGRGKRGKMSWQDIEILNDPRGRPVIKLRGATKEHAKRLGVEKIHVSLSHTRQLAAALVILESNE